MRAIAIKKAEEHLRLAQEVISDLRSIDIEAAERAWSVLLIQISRFYSKLEQGSKGCKVSEPWFGQHKNERRTDPLLSYVHHARNSDEHVLDKISEQIGDAVSGNFKDYIDVRVQIVIGDDGKAIFSEPTAQDEFGNTIDAKLVNPRVKLCTVFCRRSNKSLSHHCIIIPKSL